MIYAPLGYTWSSCMVDPARLLREWYEAMRIARQTSQYQWSAQAFTDQNRIVRGESFAYNQLETFVDYDIDPGDDPPAFGAANAWDVPYNTSYDRIDFPDEPNNPDSIRWTSKYPELVLVGFSFQFARKEWASIGNYHPRLKLRISIDDVLWPGSGPYAIPFDTKHRGTGLANRTARATPAVVAMLEAGAHEVAAVACQEIGTHDDSSETWSPADMVATTPPIVDAVTIGNRKLMILRFAQGVWLTS